MKKLSIHSKLLLACFFIFLVSFNLKAQDNTPPQRVKSSNIRFGGGLGLGFGSGFFSASLQPQAVYQFNPTVGLGVGLIGSYASQRDFYNATVLGGSVMALVSPLQGLMMTAEFEELNVDRNFDDNVPIEDQNYWYPALFIGAGYQVGPVITGLRYDVLYDEDRSIYGNALSPFVRVYF